MYRLNLKQIPNAERLEKVIKESKGTVLLKLPNNELYNLKEEEMGTQLLRVLVPGTDGLDIQVSEGEDFIQFVSYMVNAAS
ncbi:MAG: hypothetical protein HFJ05_05895 [Eubacterium sp.]|nr:hypothetical protein [Eubacterium sp.]